MSEYEITIEFRGICTHFRNTVPGVPHRVVLPDSTSWQPGMIFTAGMEPLFYLLPPHFSYVYSKQGPHGEPSLINTLGIFESWIVAGVRLQISNAIGTALDYSDTFEEDVPRVADYVADYHYSESVVSGGRAECYFDVFRGSVSPYRHGQAWRTRITMTTDGPPRLQVTTLDRHDRKGFTLADVEVGPYLVVGNSGLSCDEANLDFLWHFVTSERDIPEELPQMPYGFHTKRHCTPQNTAEQFSRLLELGYPGRLQLTPDDDLMVETEASCSNSQYP